MVEEITALFLVVFVGAVYYLVIVPQRVCKFYEKQLNKTKYRVSVKKYNLLYNGVDGEARKHRSEGDPYKLYRTEYPHIDIVISNVFHRPVVELCHVDFLKDYFSADKHFDFPKIHLFMNPFKRFYGDMSIGMSQGTAWKRRRNNINKIFNFQFVKLQIPTIVRIVDKCIKDMEHQNQPHAVPQGTAINVDVYSDLSLHIFSQVLLYLSFGMEPNERIEQVDVASYMMETVRMISRNQIGSLTSLLGNWFYDWEFRKVDATINHRINMLREWGFRLISQKLKQAEKEFEADMSQFVPDSIIKAIFLYKRQNNLEDDHDYVSVQYLFSQICGLFVAGADTTSNFWNMLVAYLGKYPQVDAQVRQEVTKYMGDNDYSYENLKKLTYIDALQKEVTRVYGPGNITFPRVAIRDNFINGLAIKKGTVVLVNPIGNEFSEKFFKQPLQFRPERWLNGECDNLPPYVLLGFHAGARTCIGKQLSLLETKIALIKFVKRYKSSVLPDKNFKMSYNLTLCAESFKTKLVISD